MTVAVEFNEDYADPDSDAQAQDRAAGWRPRRIDDPESSYAFLRTLRRSGVHGRAFQYCSATTDALAWVLERATGRRYPELLSEALWSRIGAEHDALVTVDEAGFALANGGVSVSLRDLARFGHLILNGGFVGEHRACSAEWVAGIRAGADPKLMKGTIFAEEFPRGSYRAQWWVMDGRRARSRDAASTGSSSGSTPPPTWSSPSFPVFRGLSTSGSSPITTARSQRSSRSSRRRSGGSRGERRRRDTRADGHDLADDDERRRREPVRGCAAISPSVRGDRLLVGQRAARDDCGRRRRGRARPRRARGDSCSQTARDP